MVYSARLRHAIGLLRSSLEQAGLGLQSPRFAEHGEHEPDPDAPIVLVACSGGRDSTALAAVALRVCASLGLRCGAVVVDHGLQADSARVARETADRCRALGLSPVSVRTVEVTPDGEGMESAARKARYAALIDEARSCAPRSVVALAHTRDDQAETVLMGLLRSGGVDALAGMPPRFDRGGVTFLRPWLAMSRADTTGICEDLDLEYWDDPTNGDDAVRRGHGDGEAGGERTVLSRSDAELPRDYPLRSRVRHDLIPYIERFSDADIVGHLAEGANQARLDRDCLDDLADRLAQRCVIWHAVEGEAVRFDARALAEAHPAIRRRVVAHALSRAGIACSMKQVEAIDALVGDWHGQGGVALPRGYSANRKKHVIRVCQDGAHANR
ncbi:tRNA lysidine(34) synthetase TilS [Bifidobacterium eulemuris]|uniref:tRNA(Ile)-lysidine synthase n=1 Tax=Bifidobacterium eulemuris TaxID=1765219 RepID=A0A261GB26_9BIFI|nr:tRNA lysidine(34) synthetase TilS [Bifidobacterium eulemuris]OZG68632.1 tRNA(Ile)-lysidine synthetase [Bifidobacterium eulemuris]QOL32749.1 tRNA lysidine(34) synthetase TilS [Bifidobacterium eulemuris]